MLYFENRSFDLAWGSRKAYPRKNGTAEVHVMKLNR